MERGTSLIFGDSDRRLILSPQVLKKFKKYQQIENRKEAGGILLGKVYSNHDEVLDITTPNELDERGLYFFNRALKPAQTAVNKRWKQSKGKVIYLGEWHTHCVKRPIPSSTDERMIQEMHGNTRMEISYLYLIIVGLENSFYVARQNTRGLNQLSRI